MNPVSRRWFIRLGLGFAAAGACLAFAVRKRAARWWAARHAPSAEERRAQRLDALRRLLREEFQDLPLHPKAVDEFVDAFSAAPEYREGRDHATVKKLFLLSSTFIETRGDTTVPIEFRVLYSPYTSPCSNPFMRLHASVDAGAGGTALE